MTLINIAIEDYIEAIEKLIKLALDNNPTTASEVAGEVILALNNSPKWKLNLCSLHCLDSEHYEVALFAIYGKRKFQTEPQNMIKNSHILFPKLQSRYRYLKIT